MTSFPWLFPPPFLDPEKKRPGGRTSAAGTTEWSPFVGWFGTTLAPGLADPAEQQNSWDLSGL